MSKRLFTKEDWLNGLHPTGLRDGLKLDFVKYYPKMEFERPFVGVNENGIVFTWYSNGRHSYKEELGADLIIENEGGEE